ncbi:MAG TPA: polysaccharide biosynthesis/export family protein [bacterium]|nr:polysaccharide biosynthesis/export family protein [bacterium]
MRQILQTLRRNAPAALAVAAVLLVAASPAAPAPVYQGPPPVQQPGAPSSGQQPASPPPAPGQPITQAPGIGGGAQPVQTDQQYTVQPGDVLQIAVVGESEVSGSVTVSQDGSILVPMVGRVPAAGATLPVLTERVTQALKQYIRDPQVAITIAQTATRQQFVYLLGQVLRPGAYQVQDGLTIAAVIAAAGGPTPAAALPRAFVLRKTQTIPVDLQQLLIDGNTQANMVIQPGDVIIVPEGRERVVLMGAVIRPGPYIINPGDRIVDLLSAAGGPTQTAQLNDVGVVRQAVQAGPATAKPTVTEVNLTKFYKNGDITQNLELRSGDIVYVPEQAQHVVWNAFLNSIGGLGWLVFFLH